MTQKFKIGDRVSYTEQDENGTTIKFGVVVASPAVYHDRPWAVAPGIVWVQLDKDAEEDSVWFSESDLNSGVEIIPVTFDALDDRGTHIVNSMVAAAYDSLYWGFNITIDPNNNDGIIEFKNACAVYLKSISKV